MFPKLVARLAPEFVLRQVLVISMKPTGVIVASPTWICNGDEGTTAAAWGTGSGVPSVVTAGKGGRIGTVDATSPTPREEAERAEASGFAAAVESWLICRSCSISELEAGASVAGWGCESPSDATGVWPTANGTAKLKAQTMNGLIPPRPIVLMNIKSLLLVISRA